MWPCVGVALWCGRALAWLCSGIPTRCCGCVLAWLCPGAPVLWRSRAPAWSCTGVVMSTSSPPPQRSPHRSCQPPSVRKSPPAQYRTRRHPKQGHTSSQSGKQQLQVGHHPGKDCSDDAPQKARRRGAPRSSSASTTAKYPTDRQPATLRPHDLTRAATRPCRRAIQRTRSEIFLAKFLLQRLQH